MKVQEICAQERPREKALRCGIESLTDQELLALILSSGTKTNSVMDVAQDVLKLTNHLADWFSCYPAKFMEVRGIREVKALQLVASIELARRALRAKTYAAPVFNPESAAEWFRIEFGIQSQEHFVAVYLDTKGKMICHRVVFIGTLNESLVHPRDLFREAFLKNAAAVLFVHNHPSDDTRPSPEDVECTQKLVAVGKTMGVQVLDHLIVGKTHCTSLRALGFLK